MAVRHEIRRKKIKVKELREEKNVDKTRRYIFRRPALHATVHFLLCTHDFLHPSGATPDV